MKILLCVKELTFRNSVFPRPIKMDDNYDDHDRHHYHHNLSPIVSGWPLKGLISWWWSSWAWSWWSIVNHYDHDDDDDGLTWNSWQRKTFALHRFQLCTSLIITIMLIIMVLITMIMIFFKSGYHQQNIKLKQIQLHVFTKFNPKLKQSNL